VLLWPQEVGYEEIRSKGDLNTDEDITKVAHVVSWYKHNNSNLSISSCELCIAGSMH